MALQRFRPTYGARVSRVGIDTSPLNYIAGVHRETAQFAGEVADWAYEKGKEKRILEAEAAAEGTTLDRAAREYELNFDTPEGGTKSMVLRDENGVVMPELPPADSMRIFDRTYRVAMINKYVQEAEMNARKTLGDLSVEHKYDPEGFARAADAYRAAYVDDMPPEAKKMLGQQLRRVTMDLFNRVQTETATKNWNDAQSLAVETFNQAKMDFVTAISNDAAPIVRGENGKMRLNPSLSNAYATAVRHLGQMKDARQIDEGEYLKQLKNMERVSAMQQAMTIAQSDWTEGPRGELNIAGDAGDMLKGNFEVYVPTLGPDGKISVVKKRLSDLYTRDELKIQAGKLREMGSLFQLEYNQRKAAHSAASSRAAANLLTKYSQMVNIEGRSLPFAEALAAGKNLHHSSKRAYVSGLIALRSQSSGAMTSGAVSTFQGFRAMGWRVEPEQVIEVANTPGILPREREKLMNFAVTIAKENEDKGRQFSADQLATLNTQLVQMAMGMRPYDPEILERYKDDLTNPRDQAAAHAAVLASQREQEKEQALGASARVFEDTLGGKYKDKGVAEVYAELRGAHGGDEKKFRAVWDRFITARSQRLTDENRAEEELVSEVGFNSAMAWIEANPGPVDAAVEKKLISAEMLELLSDPSVSAEARNKLAREAQYRALSIQTASDVVRRTVQNLNQTAAMPTGAAATTAKEQKVADAFMSDKARSSGQLGKDEVLDAAFWATQPDRGVKILGLANYNIMPDQLRAFMQGAINSYRKTGGRERLEVALQYYTAFANKHGSAKNISKATMLGDKAPLWRETFKLAQSWDFDSNQFSEAMDSLWTHGVEKRVPFREMGPEAQKRISETTFKYLTSNRYFSGIERVSRPFAEQVMESVSRITDDPDEDHIKQAAEAIINGSARWGRNTTGFDYIPMGMKERSGLESVIDYPIDKVLRMPKEAIAKMLAPQIAEMSKKLGTKLELGKNVWVKYDLTSEQGKPRHLFVINDEQTNTHVVASRPNENGFSEVWEGNFADDAQWWHRAQETSLYRNKAEEYLRNRVNEYNLKRRKSLEGAPVSAVSVLNDPTFKNLSQAEVRSKIINAMSPKDWKMLMIPDDMKEQILLNAALIDGGFEQHLPKNEIQFWKDVNRNATNSGMYETHGALGKMLMKMGKELFGE